MKNLYAQIHNGGNGNMCTYYDLAKLHFRANGINYEGEENQYFLDGDDKPLYLDKRDYTILCLLHAANEGDERATIELCGIRLCHFSLPSIYALEKAHKLVSFDGTVRIGDRSFTIDQLKYTDGLSIFNDDKDITKDIFGEWAADIISTAAEDGNPTAQYYLGMKNALDYLTMNGSGITSKWAMELQEKSKPEAIRLLNEVRGKVYAPNLDKMLKCLRKFICIHYPKEDWIVS